MDDDNMHPVGHLLRIMHYTRSIEESTSTRRHLIDGSKASVRSGELGRTLNSPQRSTELSLFLSSHLYTCHTYLTITFGWRAMPDRVCISLSTILE